MAAKYLKFRGFSGYAMMYKPDEYVGKKFWKISFYPENDQVLDKMRAMGMKHKIREDDGAKSGIAGKYMVIKRECEKVFKGVPTDFHPPEIFDVDGKPLVTYDRETFERKGEPVLIGNDSLIEMTVCVYDAPPYGKGARLESVKIIDLIHYEKPEEVSENEVDAEEEAEAKPAEQEKNASGKVEEKNVEVAKPAPKAEVKKRVKW